MKNIALVTWLGTGNYGTSLQSYALHKFLHEKGYNVFFLHEFKRGQSGHGAGIKATIKSALAKAWRKVQTLFDAKTCKLKRFNRDNYNHHWVKTPEEYSSLLADTDVFLTGSDQIWNCFHSYNPFMFLGFAPADAKKVAYASSMGTAQFPQKCISDVKSLLAQFQHIGVREKTCASYLNELLSRDDVKCVLDPTFLLDSQTWKDFGAKAQIEFQVPEKYILCYFVGNREEYAKQLDSVKAATGIGDIIVIPSLENKEINIPGAHIYKKAGPYEFIKLLSDATLVCTDSFHACALSVNLSKDFVVFKRFDDADQRSQNSRIYDLMDMFGLEKNIYNKDWKYSHIDYLAGQATLNSRRAESIDYLINAIEN